jgi:septum formation protein
VAKPFPFSGRNLILASSSPRRRYLLKLIRIPHVVVHPDVREEHHPGENPVQHVLRLSSLKAHSVASGFEDGFILGADTVVVLEGRMLGKPRDRKQARAMLKDLTGRLHHVYTGLSLLDAATSSEVQGYERTQVKIRRMADWEIDSYIATGEPMDKAGSYGIQGYGAAIVERIVGCYFNVVGLPIVRLLSLMRDLERITGGKGYVGQDL